MPRYITRNARCEQPSQLVFVDTETVPDAEVTSKGVHRHTLRVGCATYGRWDGNELSRRDDVVFKDAESFWDWLHGKISPKKPTWVFAHNWAFDAIALQWWKEYAGRPWTVHETARKRYDATTGDTSDVKAWRGMLAIDGRPWICFAKSGRGTIKLVDTLNYYPLSLSELGRTVGLAKLAMPTWSDPLEDWVNYCKRDVEVIVKAMTGLMRAWKDGNRGNWQPTAAMLAMSNYRHQHMVIAPLVHENEDATCLERASYFGGRQACWFYGSVRDPALTYSPQDQQSLPPSIAGPVYELDCTSLYPWVCSNYELPYQLKVYIDNPSVNDLQAALKKYCVIADVTVEGFDAEYPLRIADELGSTIYPIGRYQTAIADPELRRAFASGHVIKCHRMACYNRGPILWRYMDYWLSQRAECRRSGDVPGEQLAKIMANSLYGKFGQRTARWQVTEDVTPLELWGSWSYYNSKTKRGERYRAFAGIVQKLHDKGEGRFAFPALCACVTSAGRERMTEFMSACPDASVLYSYTDSLVVTQGGFDALSKAGFVRSDMPGSLRLKGVYSSANFRGPGNWTAEGIDRVSGIHPSSTRIGPSTWLSDRFPSATDGITKQPDGSLTIQVQTIHRPGLHRGQWVSASGWAAPIALGWETSAVRPPPHQG